MWEGNAPVPTRPKPVALDFFPNTRLAVDPSCGMERYRVNPEWPPGLERSMGHDLPVQVDPVPAYTTIRLANPTDSRECRHEAHRLAVRFTELAQLMDRRVVNSLEYKNRKHRILRDK